MFNSITLHAGHPPTRKMVSAGFGLIITVVVPATPVEPYV